MWQQHIRCLQLVTLKFFPSPRRFGDTGQGSRTSCDAASLQEQELQTLLTEEEQLVITTRLHQVLRPFVLRRMKESINLAIPEKVRGCGRWEGRLRQWLSHLAACTQTTSPANYPLNPTGSERLCWSAPCRTTRQPSPKCWCTAFKQTTVGGRWTALAPIAETRWVSNAISFPLAIDTTHHLYSPLLPTGAKGVPVKGVNNVVMELRTISNHPLLRCVVEHSW